MIKIKTLPLGMLQTNCYICSDESNNCTVIDPGANADVVIREIKNKNLNLVNIILTHGHFDHVTAVKELNDEYSEIPIYIHKEDYELYKRARYITSEYTGVNFSNYQMPEILNFMSDKDIIKTGNISFRVIHTPGHTRGGVCLLNDGILFSGDTLFRLSIGRTDLEGGNTGQLFSSIVNKLFTLDENIKVYPGHGEPTEIGYEKLHNPYFMGRG